jgi:hypothetical protein
VIEMFYQERFQPQKSLCMDDDSTRQSVLFSDLAGKPVVAKFDQEHASSDGCAILLQACDRRLGLTDALFGGIDEAASVRTKRSSRLPALSNRDREQEGIFYQYEKRAWRMGLSLRRPASWIPRFVSACYDWFAGYGQSDQRAFWCFVGLQVGFGLLYAGMSKRFAWDGDTFDSQVAAFTLAQVVKLFELLSARTPIGWPYVGVYSGGSGWWTLATMAHSVFSLTLVALFLLALRWRFRRD